MVQSLPAEAPSLDDLHQRKAEPPKPTLPDLRAVYWGAVLFPVTTALFLVLVMSWF